MNGKACPSRPGFRTPPEIEEKILYLRREYHCRQLAISTFMLRYHNTKVSPGCVHNILKRHGMNRLPKNYKKRFRDSIRYEKRTPGRHVQVDVMFLKFIENKARRLKRFQYTATDDAAGIRALNIYERHTIKKSYRLC